MLNLLLTEEKKEIKKDYLFRYVSILLFCLSGVSLLIILTMIPSYVLLKIDQKVLRQELSVAQDDQLNEDRKRLKEKLADLQKTLNIVDTTQINSSLYLQKITEIQPRDINILNIDFIKESGANKIVLKGNANSRASLAAFIDLLEGVPEFSAVNLPFSSFARDSDIPFSININLINNDNDTKK